MTSGETRKRTYNGIEHTLIREGDRYQLDGDAYYTSISAAARAITGNSVNGNVFWSGETATSRGPRKLTLTQIDERIAQHQSAIENLTSMRNTAMEQFQASLTAARALLASVGE